MTNGLNCPNQMNENKVFDVVRLLKQAGNIFLDYMSHTLLESMK